jgi:sec-independent protein translocase protein TatA
MPHFNLWQLLIVLAIVVLIFGTKKLKSMGGDIGSAVKGFKQAMKDDDAAPVKTEQERLENDEQDAEFPEQKDKSRRA